jgi:hypothetical protein
MFGMKLNYNKSEMIPMNLLDQEKENFKNILGCFVRVFPTNYLGIPLHYEKIKRGDLQPLVDKIVKRILRMERRLLSYAGRIVLIKTCLASIPVYLLSFFKFLKWALNIINSHIENHLWDDYEGHGKIRMCQLAAS